MKWENDFVLTFIPIFYQLVKTDCNRSFAKELLQFGISQLK
jgi:hypothetical protein